jgi:hypothetical protein
VVAAIVMAGWGVAFCIAGGIAIAWPVVTRIFDATERGDFPGFIDDVFPDEVDEVREKRQR